MLRRLPVLLFILPALAHDMWIEPTTFMPDIGQSIGIKLRIGQGLLGDPLARTTPLINQFVVEDATGRKPVVGREGRDPAGYVRPEKAGLLVVGYFSNPSAVELTAEKFNSYLKDEGLDAVAAERVRRKQTGAGVHELFTRCAKSLVVAGSSPEKQNDRTLGFTLELIAEKNPYTLAASEDLPLRLLYENRPLAGALVVAINRVRNTEKVTARTGKDGRVKLHLKPGGMWLIKAVHMVPAKTGTDADWMSFWASLTFETTTANAGTN